MSLEDFIIHEEPVKWGSVIERQRHLRIKLCVAAYAYEFDNRSIISDAEFDKKCLEVDLSVDTGNKKLDNYFKKCFDPSTGQWIHKHPELEKVRQIYKEYFAEVAQR